MILMVQVLSLKKVVRRADYDLSILFYGKIVLSDSSFNMSVVDVNIMALWRRIKQLIKKFNEAVVLSLDHAS